MYVKDRVIDNTCKFIFKILIDHNSAIGGKSSIMNTKN